MRKANSLMMRTLILFCPMILIILLPMFGLLASGRPIQPFMRFPPKPVSIAHDPFSLIIFIFILVFTLTVLMPFIKRWRSYKQTPVEQKPVKRFPWWGYTGFIGLIIIWILAWTRFEWFSSIQPHTFFPLWFCWIVLINALTYRRRGACPMTNAPLKFSLLFIGSAVFWWVFEYLNRFVGNWIYTGSDYSALPYFLLATLSFSTVLPAVESMNAYLRSYRRFRHAFKRMRNLSFLFKPLPAFIMAATAIVSLLFIGLFPNALFFSLWISPFLLYLSVRIFIKKPFILDNVKQGDYTNVISYAVSALICGFFWELFNMYSHARWEYAIPYVQKFHLFEMPILGYAGYLPFGLECALIIDLILNKSPIKKSH